MDAIQVTEPAPGVVLVTPVGDLDVETAPRFRARLLRLLRDAPRRVVIAMDQVVFIDSSGLNALVSANRRAEAVETELRIAAPSPVVTKLLRLTSLDTYLVVVDSVQDAVSAVDEKG